MLIHKDARHKDAMVLGWSLKHFYNLEICWTKWVISCTVCSISMDLASE